jgi:hypothetical protein
MRWRLERGIASRRPAPVYLKALLVVAVGAASWLLRDPVWAALRAHPYFAVTDLSIRGAGPLLSEEEILAWLGVSAETRIWDMSPSRVRARLEMHPLIERASVHRTFPNRFVIRVRERHAEALALLDDLYFVGRDGQVLKRFEPGDDPDFPIVTGLGPSPAAGFRVWAVRRGLRLQRLCQRMDCFGGVSEIHFDPQRGMVLYPRQPRVEVVLGWGSWREKIRRAERALRTWEGRTHRLVGVRVQFRNQVVVELHESGKKPGRRESGPRNRAQKT